MNVKLKDVRIERLATSDNSLNVVCKLLIDMITFLIHLKAITLRAESLSIFLDESGKGKKTLSAASTFRIEYALKIQMYLLSARMTSNQKTNISEQLWKTHDNQGIIPLETQDSSYPWNAISIFTERDTPWAYT